MTLREIFIKRGNIFFDEEEKYAFCVKIVGTKKKLTRVRFVTVKSIEERDYLFFSFFFCILFFRVKSGVSLTFILHRQRLLNFALGKSMNCTMLSALIISLSLIII